MAIGHYNPHLIGDDLNGPIGTDANGYNFGPALLWATEEGKWVSYVYRSPESTGSSQDYLGAAELKLSWIVRHNGLLFGSGWYTSADEYTKMVVDRAIARYHSDGLEATQEYYNSPDSVDGQWYVFITDHVDNIPAQHNIIGHHNPDFLGRLLTDFIGREEFEGSEMGDWVSYRDINPVTGEMEGKQIWMVEHDTLVFASGWYHDEGN